MIQTQMNGGTPYSKRSLANLIQRQTHCFLLRPSLIFLAISYKLDGLIAYLDTTHVINVYSIGQHFTFYVSTYQCQLDQTDLGINIF